MNLNEIGQRLAVGGRKVVDVEKVVNFDDE